MGDCLLVKTSGQATRFPTFIQPLQQRRRRQTEENSPKEKNIQIG